MNHWPKVCSYTEITTTMLHLNRSVCARVCVFISAEKMEQRGESDLQEKQTPQPESPRKSPALLELQWANTHTHTPAWVCRHPNSSLLHHKQQELSSAASPIRHVDLLRQRCLPSFFPASVNSVIYHDWAFADCFCGWWLCVPVLQHSWKRKIPRPRIPELRCSN